MKQHIINDIYAIRKTLESLDKSDFHSNASFHLCFSNFPIGCGEGATNLLGLYLKQKYDINTEYVSAKGLGNNQEQSHTWLMCDGFIVDITADQFNEGGHDVTDVMIMKESYFHTLFDDIDVNVLVIEALKETAVESVLCKVINNIDASEKLPRKPFKRS